MEAQHSAVPASSPSFVSSANTLRVLSSRSLMKMLTSIGSRSTGGEVSLVTRLKLDFSPLTNLGLVCSASSQSTFTVHWSILSSMSLSVMYGRRCQKPPRSQDNNHWSLQISTNHYFTVKSNQIGLIWFPLHKSTLTTVSHLHTLSKNVDEVPSAYFKSGKKSLRLVQELCFWRERL